MLNPCNSKMVRAYPPFLDPIVHYWVSRFIIELYLVVRGGIVRGGGRQHDYDGQL